MIMDTMKDQTISIEAMWRRLVAHGRAVGIFVLAATLATAIVVFLMPPWFKSSASLLPPGEEETGFGLARFFRSSSVPGIRLPTQSTPAEVMIAVLNSRRLGEEIVNRFDLKKVYQRRFMEDAVKDLGSHVKFKLTDAGTIDMSLEDQDPKRAAAMLQAYIDQLDRFNREVRTTKGRRTRLFVEQRLTECKIDMAKAEQTLADYQALHKAAVISPGQSSATEAAARIYAQRTALQVRLGIVRGYAREGSQEVQQIVDQLAQLDIQLRALPETGLELARLVREVQKQEQLYVLLTAQYEEARIDEARDVVTVDVLDPPQPPERKSHPHRLLVIIAGFLLSSGLGMAYALFQEEKRPGSPGTGAR
jgi:uncharacterized protein involved in exopolysaccharide biosynthesis